MTSSPSATETMRALVADGVPRMNVSITWHRPVWAGRPRERTMLAGTAGPNYRRTQRAKFMRRLLLRSQSGKATPSA